MEGDCPDWLNEEYLESAIRSGENDQTVKIISSEVVSMAAQGNHFMSNMYRTNVHLMRASAHEDIALVVKVAPTKQEQLQMAEEGNLFELELSVLRNISPKMHQLRQKLPFGNHQPFTPKYLYSHRNPIAILMEDLSKAGFKLPVRQMGLDYEHSLLVMKTLASYHATSVILNNNNPDLFEIFKKKDPNIPLCNIIDIGSEAGMKKLKNEIESWPGYEMYVDKIENMRRNAGDKWLAARCRVDGDFNVLIHGDLWLTNIMFRYSQDTGAVEDVRFIDFQFSYWTSPVVDLLYFLNSSTEINITDRHEELIEEYHRTLTDNLTFFGFASPSLEELNDQIQKRCEIGLRTALGFRSLVLADENQIQELNTEIDKTVHFSESYKHAVRVLLPVLNSRGWF